jgi:hypothetical protein
MVPLQYLMSNKLNPEKADVWVELEQSAGVQYKHPLRKLHIF